MALFVATVGMIEANVVWIDDGAMGVQLVLPRGPKRDRLIRKLFTNGLDSTEVSTSTWQASLGLIKRIWTLRTEPNLSTGAAEVEPEEEKLPKRTLVMQPIGRAVFEQLGIDAPRMLPMPANEDNIGRKSGVNPRLVTSGSE